MIDVHVEPLQGDWMTAIAAPVRDNAVRIAWLGQAGFAVRWGGWLGFIDPYISDSLRRKYAGTDKPHDRLMSPPVAAEAVRGVNAVLATHAHSDHLDPGTLPAVARNNPACRFVVPKAERQAALDRGCPEPSLVLLDAGDRVALADGVSVEAIPAAHEELTVNDRGEQVHLGYILRIGPFTLYHSGDCAPYVGLAERVAAAAPDLALLPVNGRDAARLSKGILGNFTFEEAVALCRQAGVPVMVAHHWGMFRNNTVDPAELRKQIAGLDAAVRVYLPDEKNALRVEKGTRA
jgi:L-ascorbate metabolism protein UlaG (beta-lactamase superfamily)